MRDVDCGTEVAGHARPHLFGDEVSEDGVLRIGLHYWHWRCSSACIVRTRGRSGGAMGEGRAAVGFRADRCP